MFFSSSPAPNALLERPDRVAAALSTSYGGERRCLGPRAQHRVSTTTGSGTAKAYQNLLRGPSHAAWRRRRHAAALLSTPALCQSRSAPGGAADVVLAFQPFDVKEQGPHGAYTKLWVSYSSCPAPPAWPAARVVVRGHADLRRSLPELVAQRHDGERWHLLVTSRAEAASLLRRIEARASKRIRGEPLFRLS